MKKITILVVDDNKSNLQNAENQFKNKNVNLITCHLFSAAAVMIKNKKFDIVLTDMMLPGEAEGISSDNPQIGKDTPYGLVLSIAAKNAGVPYVAIVTDINHHAGPIPWAIDQILGKNEFVSCFGESNKNWLKVAEGFMPIEDLATPEIDKNKKTILFIGKSEIINSWAEEFSREFNVITIHDYNVDKVTASFTENKPDITWLNGEVAYGNSCDEQKVFMRLQQMKTPEQKVINSGFLLFDHEDFIRLPFGIDEMRTKLGLVEA
ncbi:MAG: response regulator [Candidatus Pacebacteria bacterium]|nr:response regulator [Candidatus Paceibacterota bacterium]